MTLEFKYAEVTYKHDEIHHIYHLPLSKHQEFPIIYLSALIKPKRNKHDLGK